MNYNIYTFIFIEFIFFIFFNYYRNSNLKKYIIFFMVTFLAIYLGLRKPEIGVDTQTYINEYLTGTGGYFKEKGFKYLGYFLYLFKKEDYKFYLVVISLLNTYLYYFGFYSWIKKKNDFYFIFWTFIFNITYLYGSINILRQSIAGGFLLISFSFVCKKKYMYCFFFVIIGFLFHQTIIFFIPIFFLYNIYKKIKNKYLIIILLYILSCIIKNILNLYEKFYIYYNFMEANKSFYFKIIILIIFYILYSNRKYKNLFYEYILFYGICILIFFINYKLISGRLIYYINIFIPIILIESYNFKKRKRIYTFLIWIYHIGILFYPSTVIMFKWF